MLSRVCHQATNYLDGRNKDYVSQEGSMLVTNCTLQGDKCLQWTIKQLMKMLRCCVFIILLILGLKKKILQRCSMFQKRQMFHVFVFLLLYYFVWHNTTQYNITLHDHLRMTNWIVFHPPAWKIIPLVLRFHQTSKENEGMILHSVSLFVCLF